MSNLETFIESLVHHHYQTQQQIQSLLTVLTQPSKERELHTEIVQMDVTKTSGYQQIRVPFLARYVSVINNTAASVWLADGLQTVQPPLALPVAEASVMPFAIQPTQAVTVFWSGNPTAQNNAIILQFSDQPVLPASANLMQTVGQNVNVINTPNVNASLTGRNATYQRVLQNQAITANGFVSVVINAGIGTKSINAIFKTAANAQLQIVPCDAGGNILFQSASLVTTATSTQGVGTVADLGGAQYFGLLVIDKSSAANTCTLVDLYFTKA